MLPPEQTTSADLPAALASTLSGRLPCSRCGYLLEGLSVRDVCPECGLPITTTILAAVDPFAEELQSLTRPRAAAAALVVWSGAALGAAAWGWTARAADAAVAAGATRLWEISPVVLLALAALSGAGSVVFMRPARRWPRRATLLATIGALGYIPLLLVLWAIHVGLDADGQPPYFGSGVDAERHGLRLLLLAIMAGILLCLRPAARQLVARSLRLRQGRVDRQTILAMLACIGVAAAGDVAMLAGQVATGLTADILRVAGLALIGAGSALMTLGLAGMLVDAVRIARAIVSPAPSLRRVLTPAGAGSAEVAPDG
jgi:hypothetical protein